MLLVGGEGEGAQYIEIKCRGINMEKRGGGGGGRKIKEGGERESVYSRTNKCFMNVLFHNKGMDMIDLPRILNSKRVMATVPSYLKGPPLLLVTPTLEQ